MYLYSYTSLLFSVGIGSLKAPTAVTSCAENSVYLAKINNILEEIASNYIIRVVATIVIIYQQCNIHFL